MKPTCLSYSIKALQGCQLHQDQQQPLLPLPRLAWHPLTVGPNCKNPTKIRLKNSRNWLIIIITATLRQILNMKQMKWPKTEIVWTCLENSWNHLRYIYFWRVLVIWNHLESVAGLASSFKDKVKIEKKHGTGENQPDQKKKVKVEEGGKIKSTGGKINKNTSQTATLVRKWLNCVFRLLKKKLPQKFF